MLVKKNTLRKSSVTKQIEVNDMETNTIRKKIEKLPIKEAINLIPKDGVCVPKKDLLTITELHRLYWAVGNSTDRSVTKKEARRILEKLKALKDSES